MTELRRSIIGWTGIIDADTGEELPVNEDNQKIVFEALFETDEQLIKDLIDFLDKESIVKN